MTRRSRGREVALQLLFQREHNPKLERGGIEQFAHERLREDGIRKFCLFLYDGVIAQLADIDAKISAAAENWRLSRMPTVDRNILRLGAFELLQSSDLIWSHQLNQYLLGKKETGSDLMAWNADPKSITKR